MRKINKITIALIALAVCVTTLGWHLYSQSRDFTVTFFDIPLGDAILLQLDSGETVLIDGGSDPTIGDKLGSTLPFWQRRIDLLIVTHPDGDHLWGALHIALRYQIGMILISGVSSKSPFWQQLQQLATSKQIPVKYAYSNTDFMIGGTQFDVIAPIKNLLGKYDDNPNNNAVALRVTSPDGSSFLLTADIEAEAEEKIISNGQSLRSDIVKLAHHGSQTSSTDNFLQLADPQLAIITAAVNNKFGHPHDSTLNRLKKYKIPWLQTGIAGDIRITSKNGTISVLSTRTNERQSFTSRGWQQ